MGTEKRARQKANRAARIQAAEAEVRKAKSRSTGIRIGAVVIAGLAVIALLVFLNRDKDDTAVNTAAPGSTTTLPLASTTSSTAPTTTTGEPLPCPAADGSSPKTQTFPSPPPMCIDPAKTYKAKVATSMGDFTITLDAVKAPTTVNNFVYLSRYHYYDGLDFHRIIPTFVIQGGDPNGDGSGGPGYVIPDELPQAVSDYVPGSVAMANRGPDTGGSQFFIWTGPNPLPTPDYALFGQVTEGYDTTVKAISATGSDSGTPSSKTTITTITIEES